MQARPDWFRDDILSGWSETGEVILLRAVLGPGGVVEYLPVARFYPLLTHQPAAA